MKTRWKVLWLIIGLFLACHSWAATSVYDLAGRWNGELQFGEVKMRLLLKAGADPSLMAAFRQHGRNVIVQDKHNGTGMRFVTAAAPMGPG